MSDIQSVKRAFDILKAIAGKSNGDGDGLSLTEIAARASLPKSTASRMLSTLQAVGAVERVGEREGFRLGDELIALTAHTPYPRSLAAIARPFLQELASATGETLTLCVPDGDCARYIDQINSPRALQVRDWTGQALPLHAASDGKLYLAARADAQIERYLSRPMRRFTRNTMATPSGLWRELRAIRKKGYAWTSGEYDAEVAGVAAPIRDPEGHVVASVCLFGPALRWPKERDAGDLIKRTMATADKISARLAAAQTAQSRR
jgi:DNA-binding IclR family transcriptional regulator